MALSAPVRAVPLHVAARVGRVPLVGRAGLLPDLRDRAVAAFDGQPTAILFSGEVGVGKSRLLAELERIVAADVPGLHMVLADGSFATADAEHHPDLLWAARGGGNLGVVTLFLFRLHPVATVVAGPVFWPVARKGRGGG